MNDGIEIERDETSDECDTMLRVSESRDERNQGDRIGVAKSDIEQHNCKRSRKESKRAGSNIS